MEELGTDTLKKLAPCWSLAGDDRLLTILQNTHQRLVARCQEASARLEHMAVALGDASVRLQNINNQFTALSSSQFIESRVYEDEADGVTETHSANEVPKPPPPDELSVLKSSLAVIERTHEVITIVNDSDTSDTDDEVPDRQVMKARDVYADRPLPYIIGSEPWKNKWHAGLVVEDSDTESSTSKVGVDSEQYSQSEPEESAAHVTAPRDSHLSDSSAELTPQTTPAQQPSAADVASELARRLGAVQLPPKRVEPEPEYAEPAKATVRKIYKPQEPVASTIFPDEPPPLDEQTDSDTDIFADLHRQQPYARHHVAEDLFGASADDGGGDIFSDFADQTSIASKPTSLFDAGPKPHMFDRQHIVAAQLAGHAKVTEQPASGPQHEAADASDDKAAKKPIGGISLFGSNKGAESIGAAILKRNQRRSSSSDEGSAHDIASQPPNINQKSKKEKDIFDDLFTKSQTKKITPKVAKDIKPQIPKKNDENVKKETPKPVDLFSDNLFDDIDDIFTTNVVKNVKDNKKSIFEDNDDLFSDITAPKKENLGVNNSENKKGLFDSDDDLFSDKPSVSSKPETTKLSLESRKVKEDTKELEPEVINSSRLFVDENKENDVFSNVKTNNNIKAQNTSNKNTNLSKPVGKSKSVFNSPSLFDEDDDASDFLENFVKSPSLSHKTSVKSGQETVEDSKIISLKPNKHLDENSTKIDSEASDPTKSFAHEHSDLVKTDTNKQLYDKNDSKLFKSELITDKNKDSKIIHIAAQSNICDTKQGFKETVNPICNVNINNAAVVNISNNSNMSDDDFSEQDFDDKPIPDINSKISNNYKASSLTNETVAKISQSKNNETVIHDIINSALEEDILATRENINENGTNIKNVNSDIFSNVILEPPVFEKPKEPKKSKNVNALFDDDSDDEALFFKKDEVVSDDNPEEFSTVQDRLFDIFTNVPPEVDVNKLSDDLDDELFNRLPKPTMPSEKPIETNHTHEDESLIDSTSNSENKNVSVISSTEDKLELKRSETTVPEAKNEIGDIFKLLSAETSAKTLSFKEVNLFKQTVSPDPPTINKQDQASRIYESDIKDDIFKSSDKEDISTSNKNIIKPRTQSPNVNNANAQSSPITENSIFNDKKGADDILKQPANLTPKSIKDEYSSDDEDGLFKSLPIQLSKSTSKSSTTYNQELSNKNDDDEYFQSLPNLETVNLDKEDSSKSMCANQKTLFTESASSPEKSEKKIGRLKVGLNINVKALLPGASPKKVKTVDNLDGQAQSIVEVQKDDSGSVQAIVFENKPESDILDNKLSKERPRIQVKRRPSTRKARKEAVRKSAIDFGEDSTDNSSSIDDNLKSRNELHTDNIQAIDNINDIERADNENDKKVETKDLDDDMESSESDYKWIPKPTQTEDVTTQATIQSEKQPVRSTSTTKIVYILNDEDIFNTTAVETLDIKNSSKDTLSQKDSVIVNVAISVDKHTENTSDEQPEFSDLAKSLDSNQNLNRSNLTINIAKDTEISGSSLDHEPVIKSLGKTYQSARIDENKTSLFNDNDDETFKNKTPAHKASIFDSDSDDELFGINKKAEVKKVVKVKGSLFGDDDDDDLFGVKTTKTIDSRPHSTTAVPSAKGPPKPTQTVFEDPLSMFGDDE